jgi:trigger factor
MEIRVHEEGPTRRVLDLTLAPDEVQRHLERVATDMQRRAALPGFRRGRVPRSVLEARFGDTIQEEALESAVQEAYGKAIRDHELTPVAPARMENVQYRPGEPLSFRVVLEVRPKVEPGDYRELPLTRRVRDISGEEVERALSSLRDETAQVLVVDRPAEFTDLVVVDHVRIDEKGRTLKGSRTRDAVLALDHPGLLPEFRQGLVGASAGESRTLSVQYPENFGDPELAGRHGRFHVKVKKIQEKKLRELDDNLAKEVFGLPSLEDLRSRLRLQMEGEERLRSRRALEEDLVDELIRRNPVAVPELLVDRLSAEAYQRAVAGGGAPAPDDDLALRAGLRQAMERRVQRDWLLEAVSQLEKIDVTDEELSEELRRLAAMRGRAGQEFRTLPRDERVARVRDGILERKIFDFLIDAARVEEEKVSEGRLVVPA